MTDIPTIDALPLPPQRGQDPAVFIQRADVFIDALAAFVADLNAFGAQLVQATNERVANEAAGSYRDAAAARDAAILARDAARDWAATVDAANIVHRTGNESIAGTKNFTNVVQLAGKALTLAATFPEATTAEMAANVTSRLLSVRTWWDSLAIVALVDAGTIAVDLATGVNFAVTVTANRVLANPTNGKPGQHGSIFVTQGGAGGLVLSFGSAYVPDDLLIFPTLNGAAGAVTELRYKIANDGKVRIYGGKPINTFRDQDYLLTGQQVYIAREAQTVIVYAYNDYLLYGIVNNMSARVSQGSPQYPSNIAPGLNVTLNLAADSALFMQGNSPAYTSAVKVKRIA